MTEVQKLQEELDHCLRVVAGQAPADVRRRAELRAQAITAERMRITSSLALAGAEAELQLMIREGQDM